MSSKKSRVVKMLKKLQSDLLAEDGGVEKTQTLSSLNVSSIEKASFFEDDDVSIHGNPLHSTALEDVLSPALGQREGLPQPSVSKEETRGRRKSAGRCHAKGSHTLERQTGTRVKSRTLGRVSEGVETVETSGTQSGSAVTTSSKVLSEDHSVQPSDLRESTEKDDRKRLTSVSSEELSDDDTSWHTEQGKKKALPRGSVVNKTKGMHKNRNFRCRTSGPPKKKMRKEMDVKNPIDLDIALESFKAFVSEYIETVDSQSVKQAINAFSNTFEDRLMELISETKELSTLKKQNTKIDAAINRKRARLVEVKNELIKSEVQLKKMEKEHAQLRERLTDIQSSTSFLADLRDLNKEYLAYRERHPGEVEMYGPSSLPALLLEARRVMGAEQQLKIINEKLQQALDRAAYS
ncbi:centromere protein U isoform X2 [Scleropages formosus]|nr:centromere protein U isoform X2 [Scleropages formosus]